MSDGRPRLFVAAELPPAVRTAVHDACDRPRRAIAGFRWSAPEALHLTVAFIGPVEAADVAAIEDAIRDASAQVAPIATAITGFGSFPERGKARVLWVGLDDPEGGLAALAGVVGAHLAAFLEPEGRPYHAHVTVARARRPTAVPPAPFDAGVPALPFEIAAIALFRSHLGGEAPRYEGLRRWTLEARGPEVP